MTTFGEITKKLSWKLYKETIHLKDIDIGNYTFTKVTRIGEFVFKYINDNTPNITLIYNEDRQAILLYKLKGDDVEVTVWRRGRKYTKTFPKDEIESHYLN